MLRMRHWETLELFTWQWWSMVLAWVASIVLWWVFADKKRITELLLYGVMCAYIITALDGIGTEFSAWTYRIITFPVFNRLMPVDCGVLPVFYMALYQRFHTWKGFLMADVVSAGLFSFVLEPFVLASGVYLHTRWSSVLSFPIYIAIPIVLRFVMERLHGVQRRLSNSHQP